jgi:hypothetical protein
MRNLIVTASLICFLSKSAESQFFNFKKVDIKKYHITNISLKNCNVFFDPYSVQCYNNAPSDTGNTDILFENGRLIEIRATFNNGKYDSVYQDYDYIDSAYLNLWKQRSKASSKTKRKQIDQYITPSLINPYGMEILERSGTRGMQTEPCFDYTYQPRLKSIMVSDCTGDKKDNLSNITFFYNKDNTLYRSLELFYGDNSTLSTYYIYKNGFFLGYFPATNLAGPSFSKNLDPLYTKEKLNELADIGLPAFEKKYFYPKVYDCILEDCYEKINSDQLLINNVPADQFMKRIGMSNVRYISLEITDNYFLFYNLKK